MPRAQVGQIIDTFERSDRLLDGIWTPRGVDSNGVQRIAEIVDGRAQPGNFPQAFYYEVITPSRPTRVSAEFSLLGTNGPNCGPVLLLSGDGARTTSGAYRNMIHFIPVQSLWTVNVYEDDTPSAPIASGPLDLALDGTVYSFGVRLDGSDTVIFELPDGTEQAVTDPRFVARQGRYLEIESYAFPGSGQDVVTRWESVTIDAERLTVARDPVVSRAPVGARVVVT